MGLDNLVEGRDRQIVDQDVETGEWGLTAQIETSARGHIPDKTQQLLQRAEDERVRQALDRGCDRHVVSDVFDVTRRTTFNKHKRAAAYDFPLDAITRGGRPTDAERAAQRGPTTDDQTEDAEKQPVETVSEDHPESLGRSETWGSSEARPETRTLSDRVDAGDQTVSEKYVEQEMRVHLQDALDALQEVQEAL